MDVWSGRVEWTRRLMCVGRRPPLFPSPRLPPAHSLPSTAPTMVCRWPIFLMPISLSASMSSFSPSLRLTMSSSSAIDVISSSSKLETYCSSSSSLSIAPASAHRSDGRTASAAGLLPWWTLEPPGVRYGGEAGSNPLSALLSSRRMAADTSKYTSFAAASDPRRKTVRSRKDCASWTARCEERAAARASASSRSTGRVRVKTLSRSACTSSARVRSICRYASAPCSLTH
mmetsp:Transcript_33971/g.109075  ORF Transcript_33971/g.109075 Transcript_33971/m.109075 type:complete len:230 (-) Transcript_33971:1443-2132(-)